MNNRSATIILIASLMLLPIAANAISLNVQGPVNGTLSNNGTVYLGDVGPGESFYVSASASTTNASGSYVNIGWDTFKAVGLPPGWSAQASPLYQNPMKLKITASPYAQDGVYRLSLRAVNLQNYSGLGNLTINAVVNVTPNVFRLSVNPGTVSTGVNQPTDLAITINNTGISDDPFLINIQGLPAWNQSEEVIALHSTSSVFSYPVYFGEPGQYTFNLTVTSETSPLVTKSYPITLNVQPSLLNDYYATGQGVVISPVTVEPAYGFMLLLSDVYHWLTGS
jgi:hypothetical protein